MLFDAEAIEDKECQTNEPQIKHPVDVANSKAEPSPGKLANKARCVRLKSLGTRVRKVANFVEHPEIRTADDVVEVSSGREDGARLKWQSRLNCATRARQIAIGFAIGFECGAGYGSSK